MIKLIDDVKLLDGFYEKEPYFACLFTAETVSFSDDPGLLSIWAEIDEKGRAHSFLRAAADSAMLFSPDKIPGIDMVMFVTKLLSGGNVKYFDCDENVLSVLGNLFDFEVREEIQMCCENRINMPENAFETRCEYNFDDALSVMIDTFGDDGEIVNEFWKLRMVRGVSRKQSTLFTLYDKKAVATACIRGRTEKSGAITSVVTSPEHRKKGYASYLTALCANMLIDEHRTPWLVPADEKVRKMYEKIGFKAAKKYYSLYNIKEKEETK